MYVQVIPRKTMLVMWIFTSPKRGSKIGKAIPTPMAGEPEIAPMNMGTIIAIAINGISEATTASNNVMTDPDEVTISLR
jgi:hypothetical protein